MDVQKVVLVGNDQSPLTGLKAALQKGGFEVASCAGGFDALDELSESGADIVITSSNLFDINGYQLCSLLKSHDSTAGLPVVVVNAGGESPDSFGTVTYLADSTLEEQDLKSKGDRPVKIVRDLISKAKQNGWSAEAARRWPEPGAFTSSNLPHSYSNLVSDLIGERLIGRFARTLLEAVEPRGRFIDTYFEVSSKLISCDLMGIAITSSAQPWAALQFSKPLAQKSFDELSKRVARTLEPHKELSFEVRGEIDNTHGGQLKQIEILPVQQSKSLYGALIFAAMSAMDRASVLSMSRLAEQMQPVMRLILANQEIASLHQHQQYRASTDPLTGLYNLEFLVGFLQQQLLFSYRQRSPVGLIIIDLDNLKTINDQFGFELGDMVLSTIANRLLNETRSSDLVARYGGDEFAVVLPNTDINGSRVLAEKVRLEVENMSFVKGSGRKGPRATVSIGCAAFNMEDLNPETILRDAKMALARAKEGGHNRVAT